MVILARSVGNLKIMGFLLGKVCCNLESLFQLVFFDKCISMFQVEGQ